MDDLDPGPAEQQRPPEHPRPRAVALPTRAADDPRLSRIDLRCELVGGGLNDKAIAARVTAEELHRLRYGSYVAGPAWRSCDDVGRHGLVVRAVVKRAQAPIVVSHLSALGEWDVPIWDLTLDRVHVTRCDERAGRREAGVVQHLGALRDIDIVAGNGLRVTSPTRTALDCLGLVDTEHGVTIVGDLLHRGLTTPEQLEECRALMAQWPGSLRHQVAIRIADGRCESVGEHRTLFLCWQQHLPRPVPQYPIVDATGNAFAWVDFAWPDHGVFLEFDGKVKYLRLLRAGESPSDTVVREKRREERIREVTGWTCVRVAWSDLYRPQHTADRIRRLLGLDSSAPST